MLEPNPSLSIIIACTRPQTVMQCLEGLSKQEGQIIFEVIIVGNCPVIIDTYQAFTLRLIDCQELHANVRRNKGIENSKAPLIAFLDDDAIPDPRWVAQAVQVDPKGKLIITGPERPLGDNWKSRLAFAVSQNKLTEGLPGHVNQKSTFVSWTEVPFCNCVVPKAIFDQIGYPATDIPWDMDDFEFCNRARKVAQFVNIPKLSIYHDRYPDSISKFIRYKSRLRIRTGEKLISHPTLYWRIPTVVLAALCPYLLIITLVIIHLTTNTPIHVTLTASVGLYLILILSQITVAVSKVGLRLCLFYVAMIAVIHFVTVTSVQVGMIRKLFSNIRLLHD